MLKFIVIGIVVLMVIGYLTRVKKDSPEKQEENCRRLEKVIRERFPMKQDIEVYYYGREGFTSLTNYGIYYMINQNNNWTTNFIPYESIVDYHIEPRANNNYWNTMCLTLRDGDGSEFEFRISVSTIEQEDTISRLNNILQQYK